jgi:hypothetical protein
MPPREKPCPPVTLANMRRNGVRAVIATCQACGHKADVSVDALPETIMSQMLADASDAARVGGANRYKTRVAYDDGYPPLPSGEAQPFDPVRRRRLDRGATQFRHHPLRPFGGAERRLKDRACRMDVRRRLDERAWRAS